MVVATSASAEEKKKGRAATAATVACNVRDR
jgi:hypothetical protein